METAQAFQREDFAQSKRKQSAMLATVKSYLAISNNLIFRKKTKPRIHL